MFFVRKLADRGFPTHETVTALSCFSWHDKQFVINRQPAQKKLVCPFKVRFSAAAESLKIGTILQLHTHSLSPSFLQRYRVVQWLQSSRSLFRIRYKRFLQGWWRLVVKFLVTIRLLTPCFHCMFSPG